MALCEELTFQSGLIGAPLLPEFRDVDHDSTWETWAWESAKDDDPEALRDLYLRAVHRSRDAVTSALAESGLDYASECGMSLRRLISDTIEEYARHTGHAICCAKQSTAPPVRVHQASSPFPGRDIRAVLPMSGKG